jgi:CRISPR-associated protein Cmr2
MPKYLMTIALGPVQEFIAAARRTADLTAGSELLVGLAAHLAEHLQSQHNAELIFPASTQTDAPNKLLFTVQGEPHKIAADAKEQAHAYLRQQWDACLQQLGAVKGCIDEELANWQLKNFLEFYAAWVPLNGDYAAARRRLEQLLAGRKALRDFKQPYASPQTPQKPAGSLDGQRIQDRGARRRLQRAHRCPAAPQTPPQAARDAGRHLAH